MKSILLFKFLLFILLIIGTNSKSYAQVCNDYTNIISWTCGIVWTGPHGSLSKDYACWMEYNYGGYPACSMEEFLSGEHDAGDVDPREQGPATDFNVDPELLCAVLYASQPEECVKGEYVDMAPNGCTGVSPYFHAPMSNRVANITPACNTHDICYGTLGETQRGCDYDFYLGMVDICVQTFGPAVNHLRNVYTVNPRYAACVAQAEAYHIGVSNINGVLALVDESWYNDAQNDAACNDWNDKYAEAECDQ